MSQYTCARQLQLVQLSYICNLLCSFSCNHKISALWLSAGIDFACSACLTPTSQLCIALQFQGLHTTVANPEGEHYYEHVRALWTCQQVCTKNEWLSMFSLGTDSFFPAYNSFLGAHYLPYIFCLIYSVDNLHSERVSARWYTPQNHYHNIQKLCCISCHRFAQAAAAINYETASIQTLAPSVHLTLCLNTYVALGEKAEPNVASYMQVCISMHFRCNRQLRSTQILFHLQCLSLDLEAKPDTVTDED